MWAYTYSYVCMYVLHRLLLIAQREDLQPIEENYLLTYFTLSHQCTCFMVESIVAYFKKILYVFGKYVRSCVRSFVRTFCINININNVDLCE